MPAMGIYGGRDVIVSPNQIRYFRDGSIRDAQAVWIPDAGHFVMWDTPDKFARAFNEFMSM
jgi:pimeloyl-ACP methyl ester carboxylesterase